MLFFLRTAKLSNDVLSYCKKLKIISRHGVGYDNVNVDYLNKNKYCTWHNLNF
jgi:D-3-phosphoglycerate dehydrogenase